MRQVDGHIDFYGYHDGAHGWFLGGWASGWSTSDWPVATAAYFSNGEVHGDDYLATLYPRADLGGRGSGFVLFVRGEETLADFQRLAISWNDQAVEIIPSPPPSRLRGRALLAAILPPLHSRDAAPDPQPMLRLAAAEHGATAQPGRGQSQTVGSAPLIERAQRLLQAVFATPFVDDALCRQNLGIGKGNIEAAILYMQLPPLARPKISHFFDPVFYFEIYPELRAQGEPFDPLLHYIFTGCGEGRYPHPLIDIDYMKSVDGFLLSSEPTISEISDVLRKDLVDPSPYFSIEAYREQVAGVSIEGGCLHHYLSQGYLRDLRPNALLDPAWYYRQLDGVYDYWSGLRHFIRLGDGEGRAPSPEFDSKRYLIDHPDVAAAGTPALWHYLTRGWEEHRRHRALAVPPSGDDRRAEETRADAGDAFASYKRMRERLADIRQTQKDSVSVGPCTIEECPDVAAAVASIEFPAPGSEAPTVSILIPAYNESRHTAECLQAIANSGSKTGYEVILADDASPEEAVRLFSRISNITVIRHPQNLGFLRNCNAALGACRGKYLLLLNNDAQLMPGALDAMVKVLEEDPEVAAVGPKILYPNGRLQEAGCAVNRDGVSTMVGLFGDPDEPAFNYDRDVHYCSGAALLVRRSAIGDELFDETFAPAYCEDVDLCLQLLSAGWRVVYCHAATVVHHLSVSMNQQSVMRRLQRVAKNQHKLTQKWTEFLAGLNSARVIAFYLPQYHATPENDYYWGQGFTEWTNVTKATPAYSGHYQPHLPSDLGFYDLRLKETFVRQAELARRYGIAGFCVYYYNFGDRRALDQAFEAALADPSVDFPFCVCWANENWTRHWDGGSREIIFEQKYDETTLRAIVEDVVRYAGDPRYIRVNGKPLFLVYRPTLIPDPQAFAHSCRGAFRDAGFPGVQLVYVESMEIAKEGLPPSEIGFDASVEFPPHGQAIRYDEKIDIFREGFEGQVYDYEATVLASLTQPRPGYTRYPTVFPNWDNTPRQPARGDSFMRATPGVFQAYVEEKLEQACQFLVGEERLLFVNAWNEWAEGAHLEPDRKFGHQWLEAIRSALLTKSLM
ncbi:MAG TPA: glycoside hydrolase family 99-like domain-containing protein [Stellaceae bacterium]|jgi:GT2 family glycosyltransferase